MEPLRLISRPAAHLDAESLERSSRTTALAGVGISGQLRLAAARVLVIGAGGLGSPVLQYLASSGIGVIGVVDFDTVDLSNLQRQVIHRTASVGEPKVSSAARAIRDLNDRVRVVEHEVALDTSNALDLFAQYDVIVDGSDNFATRYLANDAAALLHKPYVWGSVLQFDGQVTVFWEGAPDGRSIDYRDLHPVPPAPGSVLSCAEGGVLGSLCGTIGTMMATEVVKVITGIGDPLLGRVQNLDALRGEWMPFDLRRAPGRAPVAELIDYEAFCGVPTGGTGPDPHTEISVEELEELEELEALRASGAGPGALRLIDVREPGERVVGHLPGDESIPLAALLADPSRATAEPTAGVALGGASPVIVYCAVGVRSAQAVTALRAAGIPAVSLRGGYAAWRLHSAPLGNSGDRYRAGDAKPVVTRVT